MLGHEFGLQGQCGQTLGSQGHSADRTGQDLQVDVLAHGRAHLVLTLEGIFTHIEVWGLVTRPTTELEMTDSRLLGGKLHGRQDVLESDFPPERTLEAITEGCEHDPDLLGCFGEDHDFSSMLVTLDPG